jgi:tetratricopeptide (TPR) repeat protein
MPYCPKCRAEYREGFTECADCRVPLVDALPAEGASPASQAETALRAMLDAGYQAFDDENYDDALVFFNKALVEKQNSIETLNMLGLTYYNQGRLLEAWRSFKLALNLDNDNADTLFYAADFLNNTGNYALAKSFAERYLKVEKSPNKQADGVRLKGEIEESLAEAREVEKARAEEEAATDVEQADVSPAEDMQEFEDDVAGEAEETDDFTDEADVEVGFIADMTLSLSDRTSACVACGTLLPRDAPFCYKCKRPHIYR